MGSGIWECHYQPPPTDFREVQLLIAYTENILNSIPYPGSNIRPKDLVGGEVVIPPELELCIKEGNVKGLQASLAKVKAYRDSLKEEIQRVKLSGSSFWRQKSSRASEIPLKKGDVVFIRGSKYDHGMIVEWTNIG